MSGYTLKQRQEQWNKEKEREREKWKQIHMVFQYNVSYILVFENYFLYYDWNANYSE